MFSAENKNLKIALNDGRLYLHDSSGKIWHSPLDGHWSIATDWQDNAPVNWQHGVIGKAVISGENWHLHGQIELPQGVCFCEDTVRWHNSAMLEIRRRWRYCGKPQTDVTLSYRFQQDDVFADILMPGILYYGNPAGSRTPGVVTLPKQYNSKGFFEEHRYPMPWIMAENAESVAVLHTVPSAVPAASIDDLWWSLGCEYIDNGTELAGYSGFTAVNGNNNFVKSGQKRLELMKHRGMTLQDGAVIEKTFYLQFASGIPSGRGVQIAVDGALQLWQVEVLDIDLQEVIQRKYDYAVKHRYYDREEVSGALFNTPENGIAEIVYGWCGRAEVMGFAAPVIGKKCHDRQAGERSERCFDFMCSAPKNAKGFLVRYNIEEQIWSDQDFVSQGQALTMLGRGLLERRSRNGKIKQQWMDFFLQVCTCMAKRIEQVDWHPVSTCEAFLALPLAIAHELSGQERFAAAALRIARHYMERHLSMQEPYWGGTLDASCEDKEAAAAAMEAFYAAWCLSGDAEYLAAAEHASAVCLSYVQCWKIPMKPGRLAEHDFNSLGWTAVSVQNMHLDVYGVWIAPLLWKIADALQRDSWKNLALAMFVNCGQLLDQQGSQGEQIQQTNFAQSKLYSKLEDMRGGYVANWQVFWITAAFLSSAAEFELLKRAGKITALFA